MIPLIFILLITTLYIISRLLDPQPSREEINRGLQLMKKSVDDSVAFHNKVLDAATAATRKELYNKELDQYLREYTIQQELCDTPTISEERSTLEDMRYKNISKAKNPLLWWECNHKNLPSPSAAEYLIIDELKKYSIKWYREVEFAGLQVNEYSHPRFDLWIPSKLLIIEYDGAQWHSTNEQKAMDKLKTKFCKDNGVDIKRLNKKHYYHMEATIKELMKEYDVKLKK
jgi:hypothetical protein